jgi:hypothetical protein
MQIIFATAAVSLLSLGISVSPSFAGGVSGRMFNLPPGKAPIDANERIGILITDTESNRDITPLDAIGQRFPAQSLSGNQLVVRGSDYSFTLPPGPGRRVVTIQFIRDGVATQLLRNVIIADAPGRILQLDVVVPRPTQMPSQGSCGKAFVYPCPHQPTAWYYQTSRICATPCRRFYSWRVKHGCFFSR